MNKDPVIHREIDRRRLVVAKPRCNPGLAPHGSDQCKPLIPKGKQDLSTETVRLYYDFQSERLKDKEDKRALSFSRNKRQEASEQPARTKKSRLDEKSGGWAEEGGKKGKTALTERKPFRP